MRRLALALMIGGSLLAAIAFWAWPASAPPPKRPSVTKLLKKSPGVPVRQRSPPASPPKKAKLAPLRAKDTTLHSKKLNALRGDTTIGEQIDRVISAPLNPPLHIDDVEVAENRAYYRRGENLRKLESNLLQQLEQHPDPYTRFEIEVGLAEVYLEQANTLDLYEAPSAWDEDRALRWHDKIDKQLDIAEDKAQMLLQTTEREAKNWPEDDPIAERLRALAPP